MSDDQPAAATGTSTNQTRRAYDLLRVMIRSGDVVVDQKLVEDTLIRSLGITRTAIREALQQLSEEGMVSRQRRSGTRLNRAVLQLPIDDILPWKASTRFSVIRTDYRTVQTTPTVAAKLQTTDDYVGLVEHCFFDDAVAVGVRIAYFRRSYAQPPVWQSCPSLADAFEAVYGSPLAEIRSVVDAGACDPATARMLGIPAGSPVLVREQVLVDRRDIAQEYTFSYYPAGTVSFPMTTVKVPEETRPPLSALRA